VRTADVRHVTLRRNIGSAARRRAGFTVMELVIAISVGAIVVLTIGSVLMRVAKTRDMTRTRLDAVSRAHLALDTIRADIASTVRDEDLYNTRVRLLDGVASTGYGVSDRDELLIYNNRLRPMKRDDYQGEGGEYESQYRVEPGSDVLWMRRDAVPDENGEGGGMAIPIVDGVVAVSIEAYDGESWYPDWDSDTMGLPWALRVSVTAAGGPTDGVDALNLPPVVTLRTQIAIDRIVPPPEDEEAMESEDGLGEEGATGTGEDGANGADGAGGPGMGSGEGVIPGGMGGPGGGPGVGPGGGSDRPGRPGSGGLGTDGVGSIGGGGGAGGGGGVSNRPNRRPNGNSGGIDRVETGGYVNNGFSSQQGGARGSRR